MKYRKIYADPPWMEHGGGKIKRGADRHYPLMKTKDIMALPVRELIDPEGCHLYLWTTNNYSSEARMCRIAPRTQCTAGAYPRHDFRRGAWGVGRASCPMRWKKYRRGALSM